MRTQVRRLDGWRWTRLWAIVVLVLSLIGATTWWSAGSPTSADAAGPQLPVFDSLTPAPFTTVGPGTVQVRVSAHSDTAITQIQFQVNGIEFGGPESTLTGEIVLDPGVYTVLAVAMDTDGDRFHAQWDFVVSNNPADGEWFTAAGQPKADQINATMRSLVEAFRWHLFGLSWDGAPHPELPTHTGFAGQGSPLETWVNGTTFNQDATTATLKSLVEAFRYHFWGISWDGQAHPDIPTHADTVLPPQNTDPWFTDSGAPIPANVTATLRSLVESFRWHFWGYSWDGSHHFTDMPTHVSGGSTPVTPSPTVTATPTTPTSTSTVSPQCDPAYPSISVVPPPPELNCSDIRYRIFTVFPPDPRHFESDRDGVACVSAATPTVTPAQSSGRCTATIQAVIR